MFNPFMLIYGFYKENFLWLIFIIRTIRKNRNSEYWNLYKLRHKFIQDNSFIRKWSICKKENLLLKGWNSRHLEFIYNYIQDLCLDKTTVVRKMGISHLLVLTPIFSYINIINTFILSVYIVCIYYLVQIIN